MSNLALSGIMLGGIFFILIVFVCFFMFYKHNQYSKEVIGKMKVILLQDAGAPQTLIVDKGPSSNWVVVPDGDSRPRYIYNKENTWPTRYPSDPMLGITWICVPIDTVWYRKGNPEPVTSHPLAPLLTSQSIASAIDEEFELVLKRVSENMMKMEKKLTEALTSHLNKGVVYIALLIIVLLLAISLFFSYSAMKNVTDIKHAFGM